MRLRILLVFLMFSTCTFAQEFNLLIGTYTSAGSKGIYSYRFNAANGKAAWVNNTDASDNPSFLVLAPDGKHVYAVNEISRNQAGYVVAYAYDAKTGALRLLNKQSSGSENPCHINISQDGKWLVAANYTGGSMACFPILKDGSVGPFVQHIVNEGKGPNPQRQDKPHVHSVFFSPDYKYLLSPDLGTDRVNIFKFNSSEKLPLTQTGMIQMEPGSGPRHLDFSQDGKYLYIIEEMGGAVTVQEWKDGKAKLVQRILTHPADFKEQPGSADIHVSPDGKFLYASNRGKENNIAIFKIAPSTGMLTAIGFESTRGVGPRNFNIDPTGNYLLVANQQTNNIEIFKRDLQTGLLQHSGMNIQLPNPVCLKFLKK